MRTQWRLIEIATYSAAMNMAIDHAILDAVAAGTSPPTIRFYRWKDGGISLGNGQNASIVNLEACQAAGIACVRRPTGGNAVYHHQEDITYSVIAPKHLFGDEKSTGAFRIAYKTICSWIVEALADLEIAARFYGKNDVLVDGKKVAGNAQYPDKEIFLQHGSIFFAAKPEEWVKYLHFNPSQAQQITHLAQYTTSAELYQSLARHLRKNGVVNRIIPSYLSLQEFQHASDLEKSRYSKDFFGTGKEKKGTICALDVQND